MTCHKILKNYWRPYRVYVSILFWRTFSNPLQWQKPECKNTIQVIADVNNNVHIIICTFHLLSYNSHKTLNALSLPLWHLGSKSFWESPRISRNNLGQSLHEHNNVHIITCQNHIMQRVWVTNKRKLDFHKCSLNACDENNVNFYNPNFYLNADLRTISSKYVI